MTKMTGTELAAAGLTHCILGIFTNGAGSGANADSVMVGGLATTLAPVCSSEFTHIAITINEGQTQQQAVDVAVKSAGLRWRRWAGQIGGAGATPEGGGLRTIAEADAVGVDEAAFQGLGLGAALVGAALRTMGVTDAATGKCTNEALADFISAWAGVTRASAIVSVCLAEDRDDNATRAAAKAAGGGAIREAARAALAEALPHATAIAAADIGRIAFALDQPQFSHPPPPSVSLVVPFIYFTVPFSSQ